MTSLPIGAVAVLIIILYLKISRKNNAAGHSIWHRVKQLDLIGASILVPGIVMLLLALQWGGTEYAWSNSRIIGLFVGFALAIILFIGVQYRLGEAGTFPPRVVKNRNVISAMLFSFFFGAGFFALIFYIAIYFQSIKGSSATKSGIEILPLLLAVVVSSIVVGGLITKIGYYTPFLIFSMVLFSIGSGLISTYDVHTPMGKWFGYQVIAGAGIGVGFQGGLLVVQTVLPLVDVPIGTTCVTFCQQLGGALFVSVAQTAFANGLIDGLKQNAPNLPPALFINSGATSIRGILKDMDAMDQLESVLKAYARGLQNCFYISMACALAALIAACTMQWRSIKKGHGQNKPKDEEEAAASDFATPTTTVEGQSLHPGLEKSAEGVLGNGAVEDPDKAKAIGETIPAREETL